jgi:ribosomal protein S18 acetylase RimI-like enzyme
LVSIRAIAPTDEPFLWEMLYEALFVPPGAAPFPREIIRQPEIVRYVAGWGRAGDSGFVAVENHTQQPIGAVWIRLYAADAPAYGFVNGQTPELTIALVPAWRGRGAGTQLMTAMLEAAQREYAAVSLSVAKANPALRLYERCGFVVARDGGDFQTMCKHFHQGKG